MQYSPGFPVGYTKEGVTSYVTHSGIFAVVYKVSQVPSQDILSAGFPFGYKVRVITVFLRNTLIWLFLIFGFTKLGLI